MQKEKGYRLLALLLALPTPIDPKEWIRLTSHAGEDLLVLCTSVRKASITQMTTQWDQREVDELLNAEGGEEAGMGSLVDYKACLQYFTKHAADASNTKHRAKWAATHQAWRDGGRALGEPEPVCPRPPSCVCDVKDTTELVVVRYEAMCHVDRLEDAEIGSDQT